MPDVLTRRQWNRIKHQGYAPPGQIYVCLACGKTGQTRGDFFDVSCMLNSVLCYVQPDGEKFKYKRVPEFREAAHRFLNRSRV